MKDYQTTIRHTMWYPMWYTRFNQYALSDLLNPHVEDLIIKDASYVNDNRCSLLIVMPNCKHLLLFLPNSRVSNSDNGEYADYTLIFDDEYSSDKTLLETFNNMADASKFMINYYKQKK